VLDFYQPHHKICIFQGSGKSLKTDLVLKLVPMLLLLFWPTSAKPVSSKIAISIIISSSIILFKFIH